MAAREEVGRLRQMMSSPKTVLLYSPHFVAPAYRLQPLYRATPPLSHLALAGPLREAGYDVEIIDAKWDFDWRARVRERAGRLVCAGVTTLTGPAVSDALEFSAFVREILPDVPIIWGAGTRALQHSRRWKTHVSTWSCVAWASGRSSRLYKR